MAQIDIVDIGYRLVIAQSWFVASELVRRHPELRLIETHPGDSQHDCLTLCVGAGPEPSQRIQLNRWGRMHVHGEGNGSSDPNPIPWNATLATRSRKDAAHVDEARDAHTVIKELEMRAGLPQVASAPASSPAALSYRMAARVLSGLVNDKYRWDVRNERLYASDGTFLDNGDVLGFRTAEVAVSQRRADDILGAPGYRYWALLRDEQPVAILDTDGNLHLPDRVTSLPKLYASHGRSLTATIGLALGRVLP
jgi:T3SS (YopN, CesT) and YbjN peptide-binding chaperone 2